MTFCNHAQLAALESFVLSLPQASTEPASATPDDAIAAPPGADRFPGIFDGLMRNRGLGVRNMPFTGLSRSTIQGMVRGRWYSVHQLKAMAGPLGWTLEDLIALAGEPLGNWTVAGTLCRHVGKVYVAAIPLTSGQLFQAAVEADRLSTREDHGAWKPWNSKPDPCWMTALLAAATDAGGADAPTSGPGQAKATGHRHHQSHPCPQQRGLTPPALTHSP